VTSVPPTCTLTPLPRTEEEMVAALVAHLTDLGEVTAMAAEVRLHGRSRADVCAVLGNELIAVEVKRTDWRRALGQAALNRLCVDRSYIALWAGHVPQTAVDEASRHGIGVIRISEAALEVVTPAARASPDPIVRDRLLQALEGGTG
jgi:hypothetical protein